MEKKRLALGSSDFREIIEENRYYVDKSLLIKELIDSSDKTTLIPRPRRFGKTLNLNMIKCFYQNSDFLNNKYDPKKLFENLKIWQEDEKYLEKCGKYPVIYLTFKDVKDSNWENCYEGIVALVSDEYENHCYLFDCLSEKEKAYFNRVMNRKASSKEYQDSLKVLSKLLSNHYGRKAVILIDEYDMPIQAGYFYGYYDRIIEFMRNFLSGGMKDNEFLERSVMTGILRVAKESIFSGLNNVGVASILSSEHQDKFGFTEQEVVELLDYYEGSYDINEVREWYNGYIFGDTYIYNPWSILEFVKNRYTFYHWWINTSSNDLIKELITTAGAPVKQDMETLLRAGFIEKVVDDAIVYEDVYKYPDALWSFFLFCGYLKIVGCETRDMKRYCKLVLPNNEVKYIFEITVSNWFDKNISSPIYLKKALLEGDVRTFHSILLEFAEKTFSYFDVKGTEPERFYHGFVLGMISHLSDVFEIKSNRESGRGRYDVMLIPKDKTQFGIVFEFKKVDTKLKETPEEAIEDAKKQLKEKNYRAELENGGVKNIREIAIAFEGKEILLESD